MSELVGMENWFAVPIKTGPSLASAEEGKGGGESTESVTSSIAFRFWPCESRDRQRGTRWWRKVTCLREEAS